VDGGDFALKRGPEQALGESERRPEQGGLLHIGSMVGEAGEDGGFDGCLLLFGEVA
jgi:hypothetical protein